MSETIFERILRLASEQREANQERQPLSARLEYATREHFARLDAQERAACASRLKKEVA